MRNLILIFLAFIVGAGLIACNSNETLISQAPRPATQSTAATPPPDNARRITAEELHKLWEANDVVIIDTHLFIRTEQGYYPGIPLKLLTIINPSHLILITAKSEEIHKRRTNDNSRQRDLISIDRISDDLRLSESMISSSSIISGCPFYIIQNNTDEIEKATDDICKVILSK